MTEQERHLLNANKTKRWKYGTKPSMVTFDKAVMAMDAYAAVQVAEKELQIQNATKREIRLKQEIDEYARNAEADRLEIARLKAENANLQDWITQHVKTKKALKAENERLKLGIKRLVAEGQLYERWLLVDPDKLISLLSPAPEKPEEKPATDSPQLADKYAILHRALSKIRRMRKTERYWDGEAMTKVAIEALEKVK